MSRRFTRRFVGVAMSLCLVPLAVVRSQHETKSTKKPELTAVQIKVTDKETGGAIENADVVLKWGEGPEQSASGSTNSTGTAKFNDVPRGKVMIRVIAKGYKAVAPSHEVAKEEQPIKIELDKESSDDSKHQEAPPTR